MIFLQKLTTACFVTLLTIFWWAGTPLWAADTLPEIRYDTEPIQARHLPENSLDKFRSDDDFNYNTNIEYDSESLWDIVKRWIYKQIAKFFSNEGAMPYIRYTIFGLVLLYALIRFLGGDFQSLFFRNRKKKSIDYREMDENIHEMDIDQLIAEYIDKKEFPYAIRLLFLKTLKMLNEHEHIVWTKNKTNSDYRREIAGKTFYTSFVQLSNVYEFIWYGDFPVSEKLFYDVKEHFDDFYAGFTKKTA